MNHFKPFSHEESNTHRGRKHFPFLHLGDSEVESYCIESSLSWIPQGKREEYICIKLIFMASKIFCTLHYYWHTKETCLLLTSISPAKLDHQC